MHARGRALSRVASASRSSAAAATAVASAVSVARACTLCASSASALARVPSLTTSARPYRVLSSVQPHHRTMSTSTSSSSSSTRPAETRVVDLIGATSASSLRSSITFIVHDHSSSLPSAATDAIVVFVTEEEAKNKDLSAAYRFVPAGSLSDAFFGDFNGKAKETHLAYVTAPADATTTTPATRRVLFVGVGKSSAFAEQELRVATNAAISALKAKHLRTAVVALSHAAFRPRDSSDAALAALDAFTRVAVLANHSFAKYKTKEPVHEVTSLALVLGDGASVTPAHTSAIERAQVIAESTVLARELANDRADEIHPASMEAFARQLADAHGLRITVLQDDELRAQGYNLLPSVGQAARHKARLVVLEYEGDASSKERIALVGKGITFDTGGLNMKPTNSIEDMYLDMSGSAAVFGAMKAIATLRPRVNVVGALALAENAVDALSVKPHAIVHTAKGTVMIANTDAEGRLALADAFTYVQKHHAPTTMLDFATLTGACVVALGEHAAGVFTNRDELADELRKSGNRVYERVWHMPIMSEHEDELKDMFADFKSSAGRYGGASIAAAFLRKFVEEGVAWAHIDIAGVAMASKARLWNPSKGTGFGVQLILDFIERRISSSRS